MGKIFIINDSSITGGADTASDLGTGSVRWGNGYIANTLTVGTVSATGSIVGASSGSFSGKVSGTIGSFSGTLSVGSAATFSSDMQVQGTADFTHTMTATTISASGQLISGSTAGVVGQLASLIYTFDTTSALQVTSIPVPFAGRIENVYITTGSVSAIVAAYTVRVGSAGSVAVATVSNTTASQGVQEALTTSATTYAITNALVVTRSAQGTAGDTAICIVVRKTA